MISTIRAVAVASVAAGGLLLAACSSSSGGSGSVSSGSSPSSPSSSVTSSSPAASTAASSGSGALPTKAQLQSVLLTQSDLPSGYKKVNIPAGASSAASSAVRSASTQFGDAQANVTKCIGIQDLDPKAASGATTSVFSSATGSAVTSAAAAVADEDQLAKAKQLLSSDRTATCIESAFGKGRSITTMGVTVKISNVRVKLSPPATGQPSTVAGYLDIVLQATAAGQTLAIDEATGLATAGHTLGLVALVSPGGKIDTATLQKLTGIVGERVAKLG